MFRRIAALVAAGALALAFVGGVRAVPNDYPDWGSSVQSGVTVRGFATGDLPTNANNQSGNFAHQNGLLYGWDVQGQLDANTPGYGQLYVLVSVNDLHGNSYNLPGIWVNGNATTVDVVFLGSPVNLQSAGGLLPTDQWHVLAQPVLYSGPSTLKMNLTAMIFLG